MSRTGLKTFVLSFCISLFMIFTVNGIFWHTRSKNLSQNIEISNKNITLFLRDTSANPSVKAAPVKKIALSVLPEIHPANAAELKTGKADRDIIYAPENEIIMAGEISDADLLNGSSFLDDTPPQKKAPQPDKVVDNYEEIIQNPPGEIKLAALKKPVLSAQVPAPKAVSKKTEHPKRPDIIPQPQKAHGIIPLVKEGFDKAPVQKEIKVAQLLVEEVPAAKNKPRKAIPLVKDKALPGEQLNNAIVANKSSGNMVALADKDIPIKSMTSENVANKAENAPQKNEDWQQMKELKKPDSPWVVAKSAGVSANAMLKNEEYYKQDAQAIKDILGKPAASRGKKSPENKDNQLKLASETVQNLLIPIPEELIKDENLVPQLESSKKDKDKKASKDAKAESLAAQFKKKEPQTAEADSKKNILNSLSSIFNSAETGIKKAPEISRKIGNSFADSIRGDRPRKSAKRKSKIMPTEMRLSFQPNRAEISGQTLRWIQAFATRTAEDTGTAIEIRIDGTNSMELQQKRLNLLHNILTNKGVGYNKINTVFTTREPNSFIIRTISLGSNADPNVKKENINMNREGYYLQW